MESWSRIPNGEHFDHAAEFAPIFGRIVGGEHAHGLDFVHIQFGGEGRRTIIRDGNSIDDVLGLVLGAARAATSNASRRDLCLLIGWPFFQNFVSFRQACVGGIG